MSFHSETRFILEVVESSDEKQTPPRDRRNARLSFALSTCAFSVHFRKGQAEMYPTLNLGRSPKYPGCVVMGFFFVVFFFLLKSS